MLTDSVSSEEDIGTSRLLEDDRTPELDSTVLSGIGVVSASEEKLGVGSINIPELLLTGKSEVAGAMREVSGISRSLVNSGKVVGRITKTLEVGSGDMLGTLEVCRSTVVSGKRTTEVITGAGEDSVSNWVENKGERLGEGEGSGLLVSGIRTMSELLAGSEKLLRVREKVEREGVGDRRSSMLDWMVNKREP